MFGADTSLVFDALQMVGLAGVAGGAAVWFAMRRRKRVQPSTGSSSIEQRVRVLERIATDRSTDLADEIEALRTTDKQKEPN
ncbi:hypothetical protein [Pontixanthobacter aquaemixtae]|uniref:Uncharacterized protein n=1 Tax=Pontixanthobacter aquaemixtae TaxID=1958940 RepID=A0A844ZSS8_9SPHN|nr:hypothetical protein [Pontixanthobacter aquaemixtae]MXO90943.1 hypothetical protein [Pontixanthobacter aquaemixtae]